MDFPQGTKTETVRPRIFQMAILLIATLFTGAAAGAAYVSGAHAWIWIAGALICAAGAWSFMQAIFRKIVIGPDGLQLVELGKTMDLPYADFTDVKRGKANLYLVNDRGEGVRLPDWVGLDMELAQKVLARVRPTNNGADRETDAAE
ncbi:MAG: hypothetical protein H6684_03045 [Deltaproteobacteria bacterium]|nr:hypothetical protein [bacterium]MCB9487691.1 hypothetical protein [Deltaproteobacteria bacterium]